MGQVLECLEPVLDFGESKREMLERLAELKKGLFRFIQTSMMTYSFIIAYLLFTS